MKETKIVKILKEAGNIGIGTVVNIKGWVRTKRGNNTVAFIAVNDGSTVLNMQVVADVEKFDENTIKQITTGASVSVTGTLVESSGKGQTVVASKQHIKDKCFHIQHVNSIDSRFEHWQNVLKNCLPSTYKIV